MEHVDGTADLDFNMRVFLFVVGLIVHRLSTFEGMVQVLQHLERNEMITPAAVIEENALSRTAVKSPFYCFLYTKLMYCFYTNPMLSS